MPTKIKEIKPVAKSGAELVAEHQEVEVQDLQNLVNIDARVANSLNVQLKYRTVLRQEQ